MAEGPATTDKGKPPSPAGEGERDRPSSEEQEVYIPPSAQHNADLHAALRYAHDVAREGGHKAEHPPIKKHMHKAFSTIGKLGNECLRLHQEHYGKDFDLAPEHQEQMEEVHPAAEKQPKQGETPEEMEDKPISDEKKPGEEKPDKQKPKEGKQKESQPGGQKSMQSSPTGMMPQGAIDHSLAGLKSAADHLEEMGRTHPDRMTRDNSMAHCKAIRAYCKAMEEGSPEEEATESPMESAEEMSPEMKSMLMHQLEAIGNDLAAMRA